MLESYCVKIYDGLALGQGEEVRQKGREWVSTWANSVYNFTKQDTAFETIPEVGTD